jgi:hypothetical protein
MHVDSNITWTQAIVAYAILYSQVCVTVIRYCREH